MVNTTLPCFVAKGHKAILQIVAGYVSVFILYILIVSIIYVPV